MFFSSFFLQIPRLRSSLFFISVFYLFLLIFYCLFLYLSPCALCSYIYCSILIFCVFQIYILNFVVIFVFLYSSFYLFYFYRFCSARMIMLEVPVPLSDRPQHVRMLPAIVRHGKWQSLGTNSIYSGAPHFHLLKAKASRKIYSIKQPQQARGPEQDLAQYNSCHRKGR